MPQCLKEEASGEEQCLPPAAALCSGCLTQLQPFSPVTFFVIPSFFPQPLHMEESKLPKHFGSSPAARPEWLFLPVSTQSVHAQYWGMD